MIDIRAINNSLESFKSEMRPWVYTLISSRIQKALHVGDQVAINAFLYMCNSSVLFFLSDGQQFAKVQELLQTSEYRDEHLCAIHNAFAEVHGEVEGM